MATSSTWLNSPVTVHTGTLDAIRRHVPSFDRRPFGPVPNDLALERWRNIEVRRETLEVWVDTELKSH